MPSAATLAWLCAVCAAQGLWLRLPLAAQWGAMAALGGLCAVLLWWPLVALELLAPGGLGGTYAGHPLAVAAARLGVCLSTRRVLSLSEKS